MDRKRYEKPLLLKFGPKIVAQGQCSYGSQYNCNGGSYFSGYIGKDCSAHGYCAVLTCSTGDWVGQTHCRNGSVAPNYCYTGSTAGCNLGAANVS